MSWRSQGEDKYAAWGVSFSDNAHRQNTRYEGKEEGLARLRKEWLADEAIAASLPRTLHVRYRVELIDGSPFFVVVDPATRYRVAFMEATKSDLRFGSGEADLPALISRPMVEPTADNIRFTGSRWEAPSARRESENGGPPRLDTRVMAERLLATLRGE